MTNAAAVMEAVLSVRLYVFRVQRLRVDFTETGVHFKPAQKSTYTCYFFVVITFSSDARISPITPKLPLVEHCSKWVRGDRKVPITHAL